MYPSGSNAAPAQFNTNSTTRMPQIFQSQSFQLCAIQPHISTLLVIIFVPLLTTAAIPAASEISQLIKK